MFCSFTLAAHNTLLNYTLDLSWIMHAMNVADVKQLLEAPAHPICLLSLCVCVCVFFLHIRCRAMRTSPLPD